VPKLSAGLLLYRFRSDVVELLLAHPGGPFWVRKDDGAWSIPKGEFSVGEDPWAVAVREFSEEVGLPAPAGPRLDLGAQKQPGGKVVTVFAVHAELDVTGAHSNAFELEWPKGSGRICTFPEVDRIEWFSTAKAQTKLLKGQVPFVDRLLEKLQPAAEL
jgi:predicted NUDIX family NTP pyrophosphohydrolase